MSGISGLINAALSSRDDYEQRKIDRTEANGFIISTCHTMDCGPETAIIGANGTTPVERYIDEDEAREGHKKWVKACLEAGEILRATELGYPGIFDSEDVEIRPMR